MARNNNQNLETPPEPGSETPANNAGENKPKKNAKYKCQMKIIHGTDQGKRLVFEAEKIYKKDEIPEDILSFFEVSK